jgi:hypothetical protein
MHRHQRPQLQSDLLQPLATNAPLALSACVAVLNLLAKHGS